MYFIVYLIRKYIQLHLHVPIFYVSSVCSELKKKSENSITSPVVLLLFFFLQSLTSKAFCMKCTMLKMDHYHSTINRQTSLTKEQWKVWHSIQKRSCFHLSVSWQLPELVLHQQGHLFGLDALLTLKWKQLAVKPCSEDSLWHQVEENTHKTTTPNTPTYTPTHTKTKVTHLTEVMGGHPARMIT